MDMVERVARAISGQDEVGWRRMPEDDRERLYGGGAWHPEGKTQADYRITARAVIEAMREPSEGMIEAGYAVEGMARDSHKVWPAMIDAALA